MEKLEHLGVGLTTPTTFQLKVSIAPRLLGHPANGALVKRRNPTWLPAIQFSRNDCAFHLPGRATRFRVLSPSAAKLYLVSRPCQHFFSVIFSSVPSWDRGRFRPSRRGLRFRVPPSKAARDYLLSRPCQHFFRPLSRSPQRGVASR